ncbi:MAG TPA: hypothetical protein VHR47_12970 [Bacillota bacterium]|nr:hypothetical protein [Bacillota bacterium]
MNGSIQTQFLLVEGKIRTLPVKPRFKTMLMEDTRLALVDFEKSNIAGAANWLSVLSEKLHTRKLISPYSTSSFNSLLKDLHALQQALARMVKSIIKEGPPGPIGPAGADGAPGPEGSIQLPFSGSADTLNSVFSIANTGSGTGIVGVAPSQNGIRGESESGIGVSGNSHSGPGVTGLSSTNAGVIGESVSGQGIIGTSGTHVGVEGSSAGPAGASDSVGLRGSGTTYGVEGLTSLGIGVQGTSNAATVTEESIGVRGDGRYIGVYGRTTDDDPNEVTFGTVGTPDTSLPLPDLYKKPFESKSGVYGASSDFIGVTGYSRISEGVLGLSSQQTGVAGYSDFGAGVTGAGGTFGLQGTATFFEYSIGVKGTGNAVGVDGSSSTGIGVKGTSTLEASNPSSIGVQGSGNTTGVDGSSASGIGVKGTSTAEASNPNSIGVQGAGNLYGVNGFSPGIGVLGTTDTSLWNIENTGVFGSSPNGLGIIGYSPNGIGVFGSTEPAIILAQCGVAGFSSNIGVYGGSPAGFAGRFEGKVEVTGVLIKSGGGFKIDHPLDPEHKYLYHSFVESPEMLNIYNGIVTLDAEGKAWVELPNWFQALNKDYRYQLTPIGPGASVPYIGAEVADNRFQIAGGAPGGAISWQVTGVRQDPYATAHPIPVEEEKTGEEQGKYLHPEEHGQSVEKRIHRVEQILESEKPVVERVVESPQS